MKKNINVFRMEKSSNEEKKTEAKYSRNKTPNFNQQLKNPSQANMQSKTPNKPYYNEEDKRKLFQQHSESKINAKEKPNANYGSTPNRLRESKPIPSRGIYLGENNQKPNNSCYFCNKSEGIHNTPRCASHKFCETCIRIKLDREYSNRCTYCQNYFKSINRIVQRGAAVCASCIAFPQKSNWCNIHDFCADCINFYKNNNFEHIGVVANCHNCKEYFKNRSKSANIKILPEISPKNRENIFSGKSQNRLIRPAPSKRNLEAGEDIQVTEKNRKNINLTPDYRKIKDDEIFVEKAEYRVKEMTGNRNPIRNNTEAKVLSRRLPVEVGIRTKSIPKGYNKLEQVIKFVDKYRNRSPLIDTPKVTKEKFFQRNNSTDLILPTCNHCQSTDNIKGFICNHNLCMKCLVYTCITQINNFTEIYSNEQGIVFIDFSYRCPVKECTSDISVPTKMIFKMLEKFLENKDQRFMEFEKFYKKDYSLWIPYFDGLDCFQSFN